MVFQQRGLLVADSRSQLRRLARGRGGMTVSAADGVRGTKGAKVCGMIGVSYCGALRDLRMRLTKSEYGQYLLKIADAGW